MIYLDNSALIKRREMLERLEDMDDLRILEEMRKKSLKFRKLETFLKEYSPSV